MSFKPFSRNNPCPICAQAHSDCRYHTKDLDFIQCHTFVDAAKGEKINGFVCVKASNGHTASFKPDNSQEWTDERRLEWASEQKRRREHFQWEQQQKLAKLLPIPERDKHYRQIVKRLGLNDKHKRTELSSHRGLTAREIDFAIAQGWLCSWKPGVKVKNLHPSLAGVAAGQLTGVVGLGIAAVNSHGEITGFQIHSDNRAKYGKYIWLSSASKGGQGPHLPSGELPVFVWRHPQATEITETWLVEGGLKSLITALKLWFRCGRKDIQVIGSAGGNWYGSINAVVEELNQVTKVVLCPDAGSLSNLHILGNYKKIIEALTSKAYPVSVAWWGQSSKEDDDIDELADYSQIKYIDLAEFHSLAIKTTTKVNSNIENSSERPIYEQKRKLRAKFNFTRQPDITIKEGFLPSLNLSAIQSWLLGIKADWGTGKSFLISRLLRQWNHKVIQLAHLNALLSNTAPKFDCFHHRELKDLQLGLTSTDRIAITDVSLAALFEVEKWVKGERFILVLDEIEQVFKSIQTNSNLKGILRLKARFKLEWLIKHATYVIASDRDLCDETLEYLERVRGEDKKAFILQHRGKKGTTRKPIHAYIDKNKDELLTELIKDIKQGNKVIIPCENKSDLLAIELLLKNAGIPDNTMFFAHGDNSNEPGIKEQIETVDTIYTNYQIVGYTMTMGTAISLETPHFDKVYGFFTGDVLTAEEQAQMLFRYRPDCDVKIWINPKVRKLEIEPDNLLKNIAENVAATGKWITSIDKVSELLDEGLAVNASCEISEDDKPWLLHKLGIIARSNASRANTVQSLCDLLQDNGFQLVIKSHDQPIQTQEGEIHQTQKKEVKKLQDQAIASAEVMNDAEYQSAIMSPGSLVKKDRDRLAKTKLHKDTGLSAPEITTEIVELERTKGLIRGARLLSVLQGDTQTAVAYDLIDRQKNPDVADQYFWAEKRAFLMDLGIPELLLKLQQPGWFYTKETPEVITVATKAKEAPERFKRLIGQTVTDLGNCAIVGAVLDKLCVLRVSKKTKKGGWTYKLDFNHWQLLQRVVDHIHKQPNTPTLEAVIDKLRTQTLPEPVLVPHPTDFIYKEKPQGMEPLEPLDNGDLPEPVMVPHPTDFIYKEKPQGMEPLEPLDNGDSHLIIGSVELFSELLATDSLTGDMANEYLATLDEHIQAAVWERLALGEQLKLKQLVAV